MCSVCSGRGPRLRRRSEGINKSDISSKIVALDRRRMLSLAGRSLSGSGVPSSTSSTVCFFNRCANECIRSRSSRSSRRRRHLLRTNTSNTINPATATPTLAPPIRHSLLESRTSPSNNGCKHNVHPRIQSNPIATCPPGDPWRLQSVYVARNRQARNSKPRKSNAGSPIKGNSGSSGNESAMKKTQVAASVGIAIREGKKAGGKLSASLEEVSCEGHTSKSLSGSLDVPV